MVDYSYVRGFNYQPGYAYNSCEAWRFFDPDVFRRDLERGKKAFPKFNTVRYWLSYDAFRYEEDRQTANFETALQIADSLGLKVVPILFNRWHDYDADNGGIYIDQMVPESNWCSRNGGTKYSGYIDKIVGGHRNDDRILVWDCCNEPYSYGQNNEFTALIRGYEKKWLTLIYRMCKEAGATQPVSFSPYSLSPGLMEEHKEICDVFLIHSYIMDITDMDRKISNLTASFTGLKNTADSMGKGIFTTETCWGSLSDEVRVDMIKISLESHKRAGLGFIVHALAYSHVADLHDPCDGVVGTPGNLCFLRKDGTVRPGHDIFNRY